MNAGIEGDVFLLAGPPALLGERAPLRAGEVPDQRRRGRQNQTHVHGPAAGLPAGHVGQEVAGVARPVGGRPVLRDGGHASGCRATVTA